MCGLFLYLKDTLPHQTQNESKLSKKFKIKKAQKKATQKIPSLIIYKRESLARILLPSVEQTKIFIFF